MAQRRNPENDKAWEYDAILLKKIDDLRYALSESLSYIDRLTEIMNMALPSDFSKWSNLLEPESDEKR